MATYSPGHGCLSNDTSAFDFDAFYDFGFSAAAVVLAPTPTSAPALVLINRS